MAGLIKFIAVDMEVLYIARWNKGSNIHEVVFDLKDPTQDPYYSTDIKNKTASILHTYRQPGQYLATVSICNLLGCADVSIIKKYLIPLNCSTVSFWDLENTSVVF